MKNFLFKNLNLQSYRYRITEELKIHNGFQPSKNDEADTEHESRDAQDFHENGSKNIIKNYNPQPNNLLASVTRDSFVDGPSQFSFEPHI